MVWMHEYISGQGDIFKQVILVGRARYVDEDGEHFLYLVEDEKKKMFIVGEKSIFLIN